MRRKARDSRRWTGDVASYEPTIRRFVLWGTGSGFSDAPFAMDAANDIAEEIAQGIDEAWSRESDRWAVIVEADESDIDEWVRTNLSARGYAPYLAPGRNDELPAERMRGTLRGDAAPRRKVDQPRPY
jgi:hypothetical protein